MKEVLVRTIRKMRLRSLYQTAALTFKLHSMVNPETYYSFANIRNVNNSFKWSVDDGKPWTVIHIPTGCYEIKAINAVIICIRGNSDITIPPHVNTLQCTLTVVGAKCKVNFDVTNSLASVIGYKQDIVYGVGRQASESLEWSVYSILVHCNIIHSTYMRGTQVPVAYNFLQNAAPGQKILEAPHNLIYLLVNVDVIPTLSVWLADQHVELLDLRGDHVLLLTPAQINRLDKAQVEGRRVRIRLNAKQVAKNVS